MKQPLVPYGIPLEPEPPTDPPTATALKIAKRKALRQLIGRIDIDQECRNRAIQQAIFEASADYWRYRADQFDWADCPDVALACRRKAAMIDFDAGHDLVDPGGDHD
jgi:hypothetical protein